jgi:hypothetical protein
MSEPDLSTLPRRVLYVGRVLQELRKEDAEFNTAYRSLAYEGTGLCGLLHDAAMRVRIAEERAVEVNHLADIIANYYRPYVAGVHSIARQAARDVIKSGWRKDIG